MRDLDSECIVPIYGTLMELPTSETPDRLDKSLNAGEADPLKVCRFAQGRSALPCELAVRRAIDVYGGCSRERLQAE